MYPSSEIRWFTRHEDKPISAWFAELGLSFSAISPRTDYYLPLPGRDDLNVKLREGRVEIKQRVNAPVPFQLSPRAEGFFEEWVKWSFRADERDELSKAIIQDKKYSWNEVHKARMAVVLTQSGMVPSNEIVPAGCQIEYTRIEVKNAIWYTFGLEWFGEDRIEMNDAFLKGILGSTVLGQENSMGYAGFLSKRA
jgi:hypothetical protein